MWQCLHHGGQGIHIHGCAFLGQTVEEFAGGLTAGQLDGQGSDDRAIVQTLADLEHVAPVVGSPAQIARWAGAAPRHFGKLEKCRLYQPMGTASSTFLGRILPLGDDRGDIRMQVVQRFHEFGGAGFEIDDGQPELQSRRLDRAGRELAAAAGRRVGAVDDATTSNVDRRQRLEARAPLHRGCRRTRV